MSSSHICVACQNLRIGPRFVEGEGGEIDTSSHAGFESLAALEHSGKSCECCLFLFQAITKHLDALVEEIPTVSTLEPLRLRAYEDESCFRLQVQVGECLGDQGEVYYNVVTKDDINLPWVRPNSDGRSRIKVTTVEEDPMSSASLEIMRSWIKECSNHSSCRRDGLQLLPSRVLNVGSLEAPNLRLVENDGAMRDDYIAFSHCWGRSQPFVLDSTNLDTFKASIEEHTMPKTFRDAVNLTRHLGIRYIWIDSLNIIQDSRQDWEEQSALMGGVYKNATLTISAANSPSDAHGFLHPRRPPAAVRCGAFEQSGVSTDVYITQPQADEFDGLAAGPLRLEPLTSRGGTVQERYLSQRTLVFGERQMFWECQTCIACEDGRSCGAFEFRMFATPDPSPANEMVEGNQDGEGYDRWLFTVETYSSCRLTKPFDKLPALGGIAAEYATQLRDTYLAGLWLGDLPVSLIWSPADEDGGTLTSPRIYRAPSWSWASVDGPVAFKMRTHLMSRVADIVGFDVQVASQNNPYGEVSGGFIKLRGPLTKLTVLQNETTISSSDGELSRTLSRSYRIVHDDSRKHDLNEDELSVVFLGSYRNDETDHTDETFFNGLLLSPCVTEGSDQEAYFRRVGVFEDCKMDNEVFSKIPRHVLILR